jgi:L-aspartate oxidase
LAASYHPRIVIIGAGLAGLSVALRLAPHPVVLITGAPLGEGNASAWAQGGIAAALAEDDAPGFHTQDTVTAGAGLVDENRAALLTSRAPSQIAWLEKLGVSFDRDTGGRLALGREAAHSHSRIVHAGGDSTGAAVMRALVDAARVTPSIEVKSGWRAIDFAVADNRVTGVYLQQGEKTTLIPADAVVLATGGIGQLFAYTTNPPASCGEGLAMAARAGAQLCDLEFVQFHPTALSIGRDPMPLLTEALRGEGAVLINQKGERYMLPLHRDAELAPRDVVARGTWQQLQQGNLPMLDARAALGQKFSAKFPLIAEVCTGVGLNPATDPLPIAPAAHYHMGGVAMRDDGRSSLENLWVAGENACTRIHGANRLASNSLLEALVYGEIVAEALLGYMPPAAANPEAPLRVLLPPDETENQSLRRDLRRLMYAEMGLLRDGAGLQNALTQMTAMAARPWLSPTMQSMLLVAGMMTLSALRRHESRGAHARADYPQTHGAAQHSTMDIHDFTKAIREQTGGRPWGKAGGKAA